MTKGPFIITSKWAQDARDLVETGDIVLSELRERFQRLTGRPTTLDDDKLTIASMAEDDGEDDAQFVAGVTQIEEHGYIVAGSVAEPVE